MEKGEGGHCGEWVWGGAWVELGGGKLGEKWGKRDETKILISNFYNQLTFGPFSSLRRLLWRRYPFVQAQ